MSPGAKFGLGLYGAALVWDAFCPKGQTVSEAVQRGLDDKRTEPVVTVLILATVAHLLRMVGPQYDPFTVSFSYMGRMIERYYGQRRTIDTRADHLR